jgi:L-fuculose-phosphate aldolase
MIDQKQVEIFQLKAIGLIQSELNEIKDCPLQGSDNAPAAILTVYYPYTPGIKDIMVGERLLLFTWLHAADRSVLECHMRNDTGSEHYGVFSTRSPARPNPIGLHEITVLEVVDARTLRVFPVEVLNGTPVVDIKPVI